MQTMINSTGDSLDFSVSFGYTPYRGDMETFDQDNNIMLDILRASFPGRSDEQILPVGLLYAGILWGKDYRFCALPTGRRSERIKQWFAAHDSRYWLMFAVARLSKPRPVHPGGYDPYFAWLADHLTTLRATPNQEQAGLCKYISRMLPEDAVLLIGLNAAFYQQETEPVESWIEGGSPFSEWLDHYVKYEAADNEKIDPDHLRHFYQRVAREMQEYQTHCPHVRLADVPWRVPLSIAVQKLDHRQERIELIEEFFELYNEKVV